MGGLRDDLLRDAAGAILEASTRLLEANTTGGQSVQKTIAVLNGGNAALTWTISDDANWLTLSPAG